jgi:hypothetical protein
VKKSTRTDDLTTAAAGRTTDPARTRFSAATLTFVAGVELLDFNLLGGTESRLLEFDFHVVAQIGSAAPILPPCTTAAAAEECFENAAAKAASAEHFAKNFERIMESAAAETGAASGERFVTETIVGSALVRVHQNIVRFT